MKGLIPQTELFYPVDKYGCNFRSLQAMAEIKCGLSLTENTIEDLFSKALNNSWLDSECTVKNPHAIIKDVFDFFRVPLKAINMGYVNDKGIGVDWWENKPIKCDYCIIKLWQTNMKDKHFVLGDTDYNLVFDPWPNSASAKAWNVKDIYLYSFYKV